MAQEASEGAQRGGHAVTQVVRIMNEIEASASQIADITGPSTASRFKRISWR
jgi:methyl-accepting chemotaxis protein